MSEDDQKKGKRKVQGVPQSNKRKKSTKISSLFHKRGNRNAKRTAKYNNKQEDHDILYRSPEQTDLHT